jgi:energy-coupling factor transport system permease protein
MSALLAATADRRWVHPGAWWVWAIGLATAASRTTNPIVLVLLICVAALVVAARRPDAPWSRSFVVFVKIGLLVIAIRMVFQVVFGQPTGTTVLFTLPSVDLPEWLAGVRLGGPVTLESLVFAFLDGLRLATMLACLGAAASLASPYRLLRAMPAALYHVGVAVVVALTFAPAMVSDIQRVRQARRLRGRPDRGLRGITGAAMPVFNGALDRSIGLAAAMDSRGYGRTAGRDQRAVRASGALLLTGIIGMCIGLYGLLDSSWSTSVGFALLALGVLLGVAGMVYAGKDSVRSRYRPDPWTWPEWVTAGTGVLAALGTVAQGIGDPGSLQALTTPLAWPDVPWLAVAGILLAALPAFLTPEPPGINGSTLQSFETEPVVSS